MIHLKRMFFGSLVGFLILLFVIMLDKHPQEVITTMAILFSLILMYCLGYIIEMWRK